ncbi:Uu.00g020550.m01.CDS01 [Anthostomella pinea]|uniref:Uu.00g020550.m01.CDS01 n=1 Tax=Anthostomella pinea TaxID=933095 RepID=A0AAI8VZI1_9PEZI|nr:Uu.00g020550.m01.CDS01 [Anthostomella pinea]
MAPAQRYVDTLPEPPHPPLPMKVIVLSYSRSGTLGLYRALNMLGYRCYHTVEMMREGVSHLRLFNEAHRAHLPFPTSTSPSSPSPSPKPYTRADFDRWLHAYDALSDIPCHLFPEIIAAYPSAKFILVKRDPDRWMASVRATVGALMDDMSRFPLRYCRLFDAFLDDFFRFNEQIVAQASRGGNIASVKKLVPPEQLCVVRLEDGLGWEQICPFLELPIPETKYPRGNEPLEFKGVVYGLMAPHIRKAMFTMGAALVGALSVGA